MIVTVQTKLLKNICLFSGQNTQYITRVIRVTWHWGHQALSLGFVRARKSVVQLLLTINCALKFYSLFMMCNVIWFMWTQWVTGSNCGCFCGPCPPDDLQKTPAARALSAARSPCGSNPAVGHLKARREICPGPRPSGPVRGNPNNPQVLSDTWGRQCSRNYGLSEQEVLGWEGWF